MDDSRSSITVCHPSVTLRYGMAAFYTRGAYYRSGPHRQSIRYQIFYKVGTEFQSGYEQHTNYRRHIFLVLNLKSYTLNPIHLVSERPSATRATPNQSWIMTTILDNDYIHLGSERKSRGSLILLSDQTLFLSTFPSRLSFNRF